MNITYVDHRGIRRVYCEVGQSTIPTSIEQTIRLAKRYLRQLYRAQYGEAIAYAVSETVRLERV